MSIQNSSRFDRLRLGMVGAGMDVLLCFSPENSCYVTGGFNAGYYSSPVIGIVAAEWAQPAVLVYTPLQHKAESTPGERTVYNYGSWYGRNCLAETWPNALAAILGPFANRSTFSIGVERNIGASQREELLKVFPNATFVSNIDVVEHCRRVKDTDEIENMKKAADIANEGMRAVIQSLREGKSEQVAAKQARIAMDQRWIEKYPDDKTMGFGSYESGMVYAFQCWILTGDRMYLIADSPTNRCPRDEVVSVIFWAAINFYYAELERSICIGNVPERPKRILSDVIEIREHILSLVRPGVLFKDVYRAACTQLASHGYNPPRRIGHGIGLGPHELCSIDANSSLRFEEGMTITLEPGVSIPGVITTHISDTFVVTAVGCEYVARFEV